MTEAVIIKKPVHWFAIDLLCKSMKCFLYDNGLRHERVNAISDVLELISKRQLKRQLWQDNCQRSHLKNKTNKTQLPSDKQNYKNQLNLFTKLNS